jgi:glycosyltransferase involved in cell wall biosynthesis
MDFLAKEKKKQKIFSVCISESEGGLEFCVVKFAQKLRDEGHESVVVCISGSLIHRKSFAANLPVLLVRKTKVPLRIFFQIFGFIRAERPDILITHRSLGMKRSAIYKIFLPNLQLVSFLHSMIRYSKKDFIHRYLYSKINKFVAFSEIQKKNSCEYLPIDESRVYVMPHTVDTESYKPRLQLKEDSFATNSRPITIGCVGRFDRKKGQMDLIEAAASLLRQKLNFRLIFIGQDTKNEEGQRAACESRVQELKLESSVKFFGPMNDLTNAYQTFDVFVMPSQEETFGMVLIEAMASGCLCVARKSGGPIEILDYGRSGILVDPHSPLALEHALEDILKYPQNYNHLRSSARQRAVEKYSDSKVLKSLSQIVSAAELSR